MKNKLLLAATVLLTVIALASCSKKGAATINDDTPSIPLSTSDGYINDLSPYFQADWQYFKSGGNVNISAGKKSLSSSMQMKMIRGKSIYISIRPLLGIEAAKLIVMGDSILLVDKLNKRYILEKASLLTNGIPVTVDILQDIFLGRAFELGKGSLTQDIKDDFTASVDNDRIILTPMQQFNGFDYYFAYDVRNNIVSLNVTPTKAGASTYSVAYSAIQGSVAGKVATQASVSTKVSGNALNLDLEYKDLKWNEPFTIDTNAPKNYKRIEGKDVLQLLSGGL